MSKGAGVWCRTTIRSALPPSFPGAPRPGTPQNLGDERKPRTASGPGLGEQVSSEAPDGAPAPAAERGNSDAAAASSSPREALPGGAMTARESDKPDANPSLRFATSVISGLSRLRAVHVECEQRYLSRNEDLPPSLSPHTVGKRPSERQEEQRHPRGDDQQSKPCIVPSPSPGDSRLLTQVPAHGLGQRRPGAELGQTGASRGRGAGWRAQHTVPGTLPSSQEPLPIPGLRTPAWTDLPSGGRVMIPAAEAHGDSPS
ncbi:specifically androgen-regulated gene protein-like isoform X2 [Suricata suricatta]|uniref:specifically androgen-regulated gene protein-like isoform X2 n=1 Tax=Suricata suricatta TaxID=37032 RepID=UPI001155D882|nr:specifically androgen-regulated gene protein-like isoform X2 [Suricata suricatta]